MKDKKLEERAKELHQLIPNIVARNRVTIAVLQTQTEMVIVGTSERELRALQRKALLENEIEAESTDKNHAEENVIAKAKELGLKGLEIGASRPICLDCEDLIKQEGIIPQTELKGKKSKNRQ
ncbi:MAG: hypothetical protein EAZ97_00490 [Bacteroidetes bacterium]|nr:MAG: hypothetical protein EAZ97_00490 [Bacteroidota bacterium]